MWKVVSLAAWYWSSTVWCALSRISELPPIATTASLFFAILSPWLSICLGHRQRHDGFLSVQAILCFIEDDRVGTVHHFTGDLDIAVSRKRMHVDGILLGDLELGGIHDPVFIRILDLLAFRLITGSQQGS